MSIADPIGDMITRIRNGQMRLSSTVMIPASKFRTKVLDVLRSEGYISNYKLLVDENNISVNLQYCMSLDFSYFSATCPAIAENKKKGKINNAAATFVQRAACSLNNSKTIRTISAFLKTLSLKAPRNCVIKNGKNRFLDKSEN